MSPGDPTARPRARLARRLAVALAAAALALALAELGLRATLAARGTPWSRAGARERVERTAREVGGELGWEAPEADPGLGRPYENLVLHPYYGYDSANVERARDRLVAELAAPHPDEIHVVVVGGSVAALFVGRDGGSHELERLVSADPRAGGRAVRVFGHSRPGFKEPQQLHVVVELLRRGARPDLVLNLDGYNDVVLALANRAHGVPADWPSSAHWLRVSSAPPDPARFRLLVDAEVERRAFLRAADALADSPRLSSAILGSLGLARLAEAETRTRAALAAYRDARADAPADPVDVATALPEAVEVWERSSALLARTCADHGVAYVHALQPALQDEGSKVPTAAERRDGLRGDAEPVRTGYPLLRAAGERLAAEGVRFVDASDAFRDVAETLYYDPCHFNALGNRILAARIADAVAAAVAR